MKKNFNRHPVKMKKVYFRKGKNIISEDVNSFQKKYNIDAGIQILPSDFKLIKKNMNRFTHFNIQSTIHKPGKNYLITRIYKQGYFDGKIYKQSILDGNNFILAKCIFSKNNIDYTDLQDNVFRYSLSNIKNINTLKKAIIRRYKKTLAHLTDSEKLSLGVAITELQIVKRF